MGNWTEAFIISICFAITVVMLIVVAFNFPLLLFLTLIISAFLAFVVFIKENLDKWDREHSNKGETK